MNNGIMATRDNEVTRGYHFWRETEKPQTRCLLDRSEGWSEQGRVLSDIVSLQHGLNRNRGQSLFRSGEECGCGIPKFAIP